MEIYSAIVTVVGAVVGGIAIKQAYLNKRLGDKASAEGKSIGAKTPAEVESISVTTMKTALDAANKRADEAEARERRALAERDEEREGRRLDREEHRREMLQLEGRLKKLQQEFTALHTELLRYKARFIAEDVT
ncbi:hypothetical protein [Georgenia thermotolerans]|uniref:hypothetical protein n=1 Tax=Georgenia thermotolerans TaxID=527326 RepID=UPI00126537B9|nr:hypothetical protein [Georgenia thermotolerans]